MLPFQSVICYLAPIPLIILQSYPTFKNFGTPGHGDFSKNISDTGKVQNGRFSQTWRKNFKVSPAGGQNFSGLEGFSGKHVVRSSLPQNAELIFSPSSSPAQDKDNIFPWQPRAVAFPSRTHLVRSLSNAGNPITLTSHEKHHNIYLHSN